MNTESRKMFEIGKAAALASAVVSTMTQGSKLAKAIKDFRRATFSYAACSKHTNRQHSHKFEQFNLRALAAQVAANQYRAVKLAITLTAAV